MNYKQELEKARSTGEIFALVQQLVQEALGAEQAGIMIGVSDLGMRREGFIGAFYAPSANTIILNKRPLLRMMHTSHYKYYLFHVLLHEYVHSIGAYDELQAREIVLAITAEHFGKDHPVTQMTHDIGRFLPVWDIGEAANFDIDYLTGIDRKNTNYIN